MRGFKKYLKFMAGAALLVALSALFYFVHYLLFGDAHHIFIYLVGDIAFVPLEVLLVTLIIHRVLEKREKRHIIAKLNMVVGVFFNDTGTELLNRLLGFCRDPEKIKGLIFVKQNWVGKKGVDIEEQLKDIHFDISVEHSDLSGLKRFLATQRHAMLTLLENPNMLEHDSFTDLLWALFHLGEELAVRQDVSNLEGEDALHIGVDMERALVLLVKHWILYMRHISLHYPYLYKFATTNCPFKPAKAKAD